MEIRCRNSEYLSALTCGNSFYEGSGGALGTLSTASMAAFVRSVDDGIRCV